VFDYRSQRERRRAREPPGQFVGCGGGGQDGGTISRGSMRRPRQGRMRPLRRGFCAHVRFLRAVPRPWRTLVTSPADTLALMRSRSYLVLLVLAAVLGVLVSAVAYGFLALVSKLQGWIFTSLPRGLGFHGEPLWWPIPPLVLAGILVGLTIRYAPGRGGRSPADGFKG